VLGYPLIEDLLDRAKGDVSPIVVVVQPMTKLVPLG
jgi:hypothetical protein